jgi:putative ABC transport system permease protein
MSVTAVRGDWTDFHRRALERVSALPGVQRAAFAWGVPLTGNSWPGRVMIEGQPAVSKESDYIVMPMRAVTEGYFTLMGLTVSEGRDFRASDGRNAPSVAIVNRALADRYFPNTSTIGKKIRFPNAPAQGMEIVGIVNNTRTDDLTHAAEPEIYLSLWQSSAFSKSLVVRTAEDPRAVAASIQRELHAVAPTASVENVRTLEQIRDESLASRIFAMRLLVGFSIVASALTLVGIYGVLSLSVAARRRELAIRAAIGANKRDILKQVLSEALRMITGGVIGGLAAALLLSRFLKAFLYGVQPADPLTLFSVAALFIAVALLATWAPARQAARVDPLESLRYE